MNIRFTDLQKEIIDYSAGDMLVKGVPGSGKSVVILQRAFKLNKEAIEENKKIKILLLSYTNALVKYAKDLLDTIRLEPNMIEFKTIDKICYEIYVEVNNKRFVSILTKNKEWEEFINTALQAHLDKTNKRHRFHDIETNFWKEEFLWMKGKNITSKEEYVNSERTGRGGKVRMSSEDKTVAYDIFDEFNSILRKKYKYNWEDLYQNLINNNKIPEKYKYDYVLVDEAQDLSLVKLRFTKFLAKKSITIAADQAQKIYNTSFTWKDVGIDIRGRRTKQLEKSFRSTVEIIQLAESLLDYNRDFYGEHSEYTDPILPERNGEKPTVIECENSSTEKDVFINLIKNSIDTNDVIGVLYRTRNECSKIIRWLSSEGIPSEIITKGEWSLTEPGVKLCTLHSAKGLEFDGVIIPFFTSRLFPHERAISNIDEDQLLEIMAQERSLLYVGLTRAKYYVYLTYTGIYSNFMYEFNPEYYKYITSDGKELIKPKKIDIDDKEVSIDSHLEDSDEQTGNVIRDGTMIKAVEEKSNKIKRFTIDSLKYPLQKPILGKKIGEQFELKGRTYLIKEILDKSL